MGKQSIDLGYVPREWQRECHVRMKRFSVFALHRRAGKTVLATMKLIDAALTADKELSLFAYIAPQLKQAKLIAWLNLKVRLAPMIRARAVEVSEGELYIRFLHNGSMIRIFGGDNPDALRGVRLDGCVIDEVAQVKPEVWDEIVQPALSDRRGWALFIGTPSGINLFSELFYRAQRYDDWYAARYTVYDTGTFDIHEIDRLKRDMSEVAFAREYLCDFSAAGEDQLVGLSVVEEASKRVVKEEDVQYAPKVMGVDPARFGGDRSVIMKRRGLICYEPIVMSGLDNMEVAARVAVEITSWKPDGVFIDAGAGSGVIDRLRQIGFDVVEVPFGGKAIASKLFNNRRSEMWWLMKEWLESGGAIPSDITLRTEIATPVYWYDNAGRRCLEGKEEIKKRLSGGASPDLADALALTFALPISSRVTLGPKVSEVVRAIEEYDPYEHIAVRN